ncbi:HlyIII protein [Rhizoctonia solani]|uniref:HlyIII protein n=1 Tax=Rhizoctonia solani TaxID=456999 RepID=A0A8H7H1T8_9AGAM|nr:HlyIII protein [Rhizoctonia solani]
MASATKSAGTTTKVATTVAAASVAVIAAQPLLLKFDALPAWMQDNAFILSGYRSTLGRDALVQCSDVCREKTLFKHFKRPLLIPSFWEDLHNESVNIHTHLFGALWLLYILVNVGKTQAGYTTLTWHDPVGFGLGLLAGVFCLGASALYHTSTCHSPAVVIYAVGITVAGAIAAYVVLNPVYGTPAYRWARTTVFFLLGICALVPVTHAYLIYGLERMQNEMGINWIALTGIMYMSGALIYACRVPERWFPGTFDFFGSSHQIFHVCVVIAALSHYQAVLTGFEYWHGQHHGVCPT